MSTGIVTGTLGGSDILDNQPRLSIEGNSSHSIPSKISNIKTKFIENDLEGINQNSTNLSTSLTHPNDIAKEISSLKGIFDSPTTYPSTTPTHLTPIPTISNLIHQKCVENCTKNLSQDISVLI